MIRGSSGHSTDLSDIWPTKMNLLLENCSLQYSEMKVYLYKVLLILRKPRTTKRFLWRDTAHWVSPRKCKLLNKMFRNEKSKYFPGMTECPKHLRKISGKGRVWKLIPKLSTAKSLRKYFFYTKEKNMVSFHDFLSVGCHFSPNDWCLSSILYSLLDLNTRNINGPMVGALN